MRIALIIAAVLVLATTGIAQQSHTICDVQAYDANGISPLDGQSVTVGGRVTLPPGYIVPGGSPGHTVMYIQGGACGINVFCYGLLPFEVSLGDSVEVTGEVYEYISGSSGGGAVTQIHCGMPEDIVVISTGNGAPEPFDMSASEIQNEENEGSLLRMVGRVISVSPVFIDVADNTGILEIYKAYNDSTDFSVFEFGDSVRVTGVLTQYDLSAPYFSGYELIPRFQSDLEHWLPSAVKQSSWGVIKALYR